jgi:Icc-related predicted phosphoesterase
MIRVAAVGDLHLASNSAATWRALYADVAARADLLLIAGDLTQRGLVEEARAVAEVMREVGVPVVAVLGNHDYHHDLEGDIRRVLGDVGVRVLEKESIELDVDGLRIGIAGVKGFPSGFGNSSGSEFGEPEMRQFIRTAKDAAAGLYDRLRSLSCDLRIALTHVAPTRETLWGERLELYPFLGSYLLGEAIDRAGCDLAIHGHAHHGTERGLTAGGIPVRNVAVPVIRAPYAVYDFGEDRAMQPE